MITSKLWPHYRLAATFASPVASALAITASALSQFDVMCHGSAWRGDKQARLLMIFAVSSADMEQENLSFRDSESKWLG